MGELTGVLLDIAGIQKFIFGTNRLRQNAGASYLVEQAVDYPLLKRLTGVDENDLTNWVTTPDQYQILSDSAPMEVAYIGGGNACLLFKKKDKAREFIKDWSKELLQAYPGIEGYAGLYTGAFDPEDFRTFLRNCHQALADSKARFARTVQPPRQGVNATCVYTGEAAGYYDRRINQVYNYTSEEARVKENCFDTAHVKLVSEYKDALGGYEFAQDFNEMGGDTTESHRSSIAIIHIDGNNMGARFQEIQSLARYREESQEISRLFKETFKSVVKLYREIWDANRKHLGFKDSHQNVPIRPIILGGDDLTFVCHGDLGIWSAYRFLEALEAGQDGHDEKDIIRACAGIAITKPGYPFNRGYELAESLCGLAKQKVRASGLPLSALDYHIIKGGVNADLKSERHRIYGDPHAANGSLSGRPFIVGKARESFTTLIRAAHEITCGNKPWPQNKLKNLREAVYAGQQAVEAAINQAIHQKLDDPRELLNPNRQREALGVPRLLDLIELLDVWPAWLLKVDKPQTLEEIA